MRKISVTLVFSVLVCATCHLVGQTQQGMSEIRLQGSDGLPLSAINGLTIGLSDAFGSFGDYSIKRDDESSLPGLWGIGYRYYVSPRFSVGLDMGFMKYSRSEEHTSELQSRENLVCRLLLSRPHAVLPSFPTRRSSDLRPSFIGNKWFDHRLVRCIRLFRRLFDQTRR